MIKIDKCKLSNIPIDVGRITVWGSIHGDINDQKDLIELIPSLEGYATEEYVDGEIARVEAEIPSIEGLATTEYVDGEIARVEAEIPSLEGYATEQWVAGELENYTTWGAFDAWNMTVDGSGNIKCQNNFTPSDTSRQDLNFASLGTVRRFHNSMKEYVDGEIVRVEGEIPSTDDFATTEYVDGEIARVEAEIPSIEGLATTEYVDGQIEDVRGDIPSLTGYATEQWVESQGYLTEHQDITGKADITYVDAQILDVRGDIPSLTGYATEEYVNTQVATKQNILVAGENITIEGNVISAAGGGSADTSEIEDVIATGYQVMNDRINIVESKIPDISKIYTRNDVNLIMSREVTRANAELKNSDNIIAESIYFSVKSEDDTVKNIIKLTQADYDDIASPDEKTLYIITD